MQIYCTIGSKFGANQHTSILLMVQNRKSQVSVVFILLMYVNVALAMPFDGESLTFHAYYQGPFSGQKKIGIADVQWKTQRIDLNVPEKTAIETRLAVGTPVTRRPLHSPGRAVLPHLMWCTT